MWLVALLLLPLVVVAVRGSVARQSGWTRPATLALRLLALLLLIVAICSPVVDRPGKAPWVALLVDRSASVGAEGAAAAEAFVNKVVAQTAPDQVVVLPFAATGGRPTEGKWPEPTGIDPLATDLAAALAGVPSIARPAGPARVVLLSDGNATLPESAISWATSLETPVDTVPLAVQEGEDLWIHSIVSPSEVRPGDLVGIEFLVASNHASQAVVRITGRDGEVGRKEINLAQGLATVSFELALGPGPRDLYRIEVESGHDREEANNWAEVAVWHGPAGRVLLVGRETSRFSQLTETLGREQLEVEAILVDRFPQDVDELSRYDLIVLADVPAAVFSPRQLDAIETYTREQAGGLVVFGGQDSLTAGDYRETALERMLPVTCEFDAHATRPSLALVLAIDQSGSMEDGDAIGLAKTALRQTVQLLDAQDQLGVIAFQDTTQWIVPLQPCDDRERVFREIETLVAGGGTNMHPAIAKAHLALHEAYADLKHIIVLTDGISYPGDFDSLAADVAASDITISTVGVGSEAAEPLLRSIAELGGGNYHHCTSAAEVPEIFVRETAKAARMGIREEPLSVEVTPVLASIASLPEGKPPTLLGYVQTKARPGVQVGMTLEGGDPLVAWWQYGRGRTAVFTSDLQGAWTRPWQTWPGLEAVWTALARQMVRPAGSDGYRLTSKRNGKFALVTFDALPYTGKFENDAEVVLHVSGPGGGKEQTTMQRVAPGQYTAEVATPEAGIYDFQATCTLRGQAVFSGRCSACPVYPAEWMPRPANEPFLQEVAAATCGRFHPSAEEVVASLGTPPVKTYPLGHFLVLAALVALLAELSIRRLLGGKARTH